MYGALCYSGAKCIDLHIIGENIAFHCEQICVYCMATCKVYKICIFFSTSIFVYIWKVYHVKYIHLFRIEFQSNTPK